MSKRRTIDVKKQVNLSVKRTFHLCLRGISHRLLRSVLTLAVVGLAVAFFMFLLSENAFVFRVADGTGREIRQQRLATRTLNNLYNMPSSMVMARRLAQAVNDPAAVAEFAAVLDWPPERTAELVTDAATEVSYLDFFGSIRLGNMVILAGNRRGREVLQYLEKPAAQAEFRENIRPMLNLRVPGGIDSLLSFAGRYSVYYQELSLALEAWGARLASLQGYTDAMRADMPVEQYLAEADEPQLARWRALVQEHGFRLEHEDAVLIREQLAAARLRQRAVNELNTIESQDLWRRTFRERRRLSTEERLLRLDDERAAQVLPDEFTAEQRQLLASREAYNQRLAALERNLTGKVDNIDEAGTLSGRQLFLLFISFLVCMVGITNAMLMSITERFREIATMKCLGATDRYILVQFMMEAALQGIAGGLLGMLAGFVIAAFKNALSFGGYLFAYWPGIDLMLIAFFSLSTGVVLAVLASIYPAWAASRMAPMDAMRVE